MFECLILGDSIAYGVSNIRKECVAYAKSGINTRDWLSVNSNKSPYAAKTVIISLGSNDLKNINTEEDLRKIRSLTKADRVYWILPAIKPNIQEIVKKVAKDNNDTILPIKQLSQDGVHPTYSGYKQLAKEAE